MGLSNFIRLSLAVLILCALITGSLQAAEYPLGDFNKDRWVYVQDLLVLAGYWLDGTCASPLCEADLDDVAGVDGADFTLFAKNWLVGPLVINEFLASNSSTLQDPDEPDEYPDWIELHNPSHAAIDLGGMYLTDDLAEPTKWRIPEGVTIEAGGYLLFWADDDDEQGDRHTNFQLDKTGDQIGLFDPNGVTLIDSITFGTQAVDVSHGRYPYGGGPWRFSATPTPGAVNNGEYIGLVADTTFNPDRGFYDPNDAIVVTLSTESTDTDGAEIYYTTNGSEPDPCNPDAALYAGPIPVEGTTTLRAAAFKTDWLSTNVDTHTYIFVEDVITQSPNGEKPGPDWPDPYNGQNDQWIDYGMDPDVLDDPSYADLMDDALLSIPTISLVTDLDNLFNPSTDPNFGGIYTNATKHGKEWERPTSMELINHDGSRGFQIDAGIRIRGGMSRTYSNPKHAFRLFFRVEYGDAKLNFPLFGDEGVDQFDHIDLRCAQHYSWNYLLGSYATQNRDVFSRDSQRDMGRPYTRSRYYHVYINGHYWGLFQSQERAEASYAESYFGGDKADYDIAKPDRTAGNIIEATDGNLEAYNELWEAFDSGLTTDEAYLNVQGLNANGQPDPNYPVLLDVDNLIDYMIVIYYTGNRDSPIGPPNVDIFSNNFYAIYNRRNPDGFKYFTHDCEFTLEEHRNGYPGGGGIYEDRTVAGTYYKLDWKQYFNPMSLHRELVGHPEYVMRFADRVHKHFFNDGALVETRCAARFMARANEIDLAIIAESARWGDAKRPEQPYTRNGDWLPCVNGIVNNYINHSPDTRTDIVLEQFEDRGWYPDVEAPIFNQHGGEVGTGFELTMTNPGPGVIYYTLDGTDPRQAFTGNAIGTLYTGSITLTESTLVKARALYSSGWSALTEAAFAIGPVKENLRITEIMYHPPDPNHEYIELKNIGSEAINLNWVSFDNGIDFIFPSVQLAPCKHVVVVKDEVQFEAQYGTGIDIAGQYWGSLDNGGEKMELVDAIGRTILEFRYEDGWFDITDGDGFSLTVRDPNNADPNSWGDKKTWRPSAAVGGSPGWDDTGVVPELGAVVINEILAHSHAAEPDWIELHNTTDESINIGGWFLSDSDADDPNRMKYEIADDTVIDANGYVVFYEDTDFGDPCDPGCNEPFALSENGETLYLQSGQSGVLTGYYDEEKFDASETNVAFGRYYKASTDSYNFVAMSANTPDDDNAYPKVGPIVISEIMYNPRDPNLGSPYTDNDDFEYVELHNIDPCSVTLQEYDNELEIDVGWRFTDENEAIDFTFPLGTTIPPGGYLLLVKNEDAFNYRYTVPTGAVILEWGDGKCNNGGEKINLQMPGDMVTGQRYYIRVDRVNYSDGSHHDDFDGFDPWPTGP
ncbi:MAG: lamin tail domain-containing protein, partial [Planctomycetota bacterium]